MTRWLRLRWSFDRVVALVATVVTSPLLVGLVVAVRVADRGPGLVRLPRVGRRGRTFAMWKIRTMHAQIAGGHAGGPPITLRSDVRVTRLGERLRHIRIDELPQLLNVVRGDMALLGPRPETPAYVDQDDPRWQTVLQARPGIAGPTQVVIHDAEAGLTAEEIERYEEEMLPVKLAVDAWYLRRASPWIDLLVVVSLAERFVLRKRSTAIHRLVTREVPVVQSVTAPAER